MASQLKHGIVKTVYNIWQSKMNFRNFGELYECFSLRQKQPNKLMWSIQLTANELENFNMDLFKTMQKELQEWDGVQSVTLDEGHKTFLDIELDHKYFVRHVLESQPTSLDYQKPSKKVIVEFSSPNIAKHFHVGHLRSTMIGNCLANIKKKLGDDVIKMNYLGDWGTQFGLLQLGLNLQNLTEEDFKDDPLKVLVSAYVNANQEAEKNSVLYDEAKEIFSKLESGDEEITRSWHKYREWTLKGLNNIYRRLGVSFDEYEWESDYKRENASSVLELLKEKGILLVDKLGRQVAGTGDKEFPLIKSDDTTLYLMRDLLALLSRKSKHNFDEMYYVVDNGQSEHFAALKSLSSKLEEPNEKKIIKHVKFGRIQGFSTRKGRFIPLSDVLDEARDRIFEVQKNSRNTKITLESKDTADILGVSSLIVNDLKRRRIKDYVFSWEDAFKAADSSGILLQYTHCRLHSLLQGNTGGLPSECDPEALSEPEVLHLVHEIAKYEERLLDSNANHEPCSLTVYLFDLAKAINTAYIRLKVQRSDPHTAQQRSLLFHKSKEVLNEGMRLIGLTPLEEM